MTFDCVIRVGADHEHVRAWSWILQTSVPRAVVVDTRTPLGMQTSFHPDIVSSVEAALSEVSGDFDALLLHTPGVKRWTWMQSPRLWWMALIAKLSGKANPLYRHNAGHNAVCIPFYPTRLTTYVVTPRGARKLTYYYKQSPNLDRVLSDNLKHLTVYALSTDIAT